MLRGNGLRIWRQLTGVRGPVALATLALLFTGAFVAGAVVVHNMQAAHANVQGSSAKSHRSDPKAEGAWFQLSHIGKSHPAANAIATARAQAAKLPRSPLGSTGSTKSPTPASWSALGPQPIDTTICNTTQNCGYYGLNSGRLTTIAINPTNNNDVWVGAADGGLWHSTNGGTTWSSVTDGQPTLSVGSIAIDTQVGSPYTIYVGTGEANLNADAYWGDGVLKSSDGGSTWSQLGVGDFAGLGIGKISVLDHDPNNSNNPTLLLTTSFDGFTTPPSGPANSYANLGVWRSTDGGSTWSEVLTNGSNGPSGFDAGTDVVFDAANAGVAYAGLSNVFGFPSTSYTSVAGVYKSTNSGATWTLLNDGTVPTGQDIERVGLGLSNDGTHTHIYAVMAAAGLNTGEAFGDLYGATFTGGNPFTGTPLTGYIYVSANDGTSWTAHNVVTGGAPEMAIDDGGFQWWYDEYAAGDPTVSTGLTAYVGGVDVWKTADGGATWTNLTNAYGVAATPVANVHPDQHAFAFFASNATHPSYFYIGNDGGIWSGTGSTGSGSFTNLNGGGLNITQFYGGSIGEVGSSGNPQLYGG